MLNPYVPGGASTKKTTLPTDPLNDMSMNDGNSAGPNQQANKPSVVVPPTITSAPAAGGAASAPAAPRPAITANTSTVATTNTPTSSISTYNPEFTEDRLNNMLTSNSTYMRNAQRSGLDRAAERGGLNSSIASGLSQREAIRAAAPIAQADAGFTQQRFMAGYGAQLEDQLAGNNQSRTLDRDRLLASLEDQLAGNNNARTMTRDTLLADFDSRRLNQEADLTGQRDVRLSNLARQERLFDANLTEQARDNETSRSAWLTTQTNLSNQYAQALSDQRRTGLGFLEALGAAFIDDPEVYSPEVVSGMSNFFNSLANGQVSGNLAQILQDLMGTAVQPVQPQPVVAQPGG